MAKKQTQKYDVELPESSLFCLYLNIYMPPQAMDAFLVDYVLPLTRAKEQLGFNRFFFIRYNEGGDHLRVRFFGPRTAVMGIGRRKILDALEVAVSKTPSARMELDRYRPENKRYGGRTGVRFAERLFEISSDSILRFLEMRASGSSMSKSEYMVACAETMLDCLALGFKERQSFFARNVGFTIKHAHLATQEEVQAFAQMLAPIFDQLAPSPRDYWNSQDPPIRALGESFIADMNALRAIWKDIKRKVPLKLEDLSQSYLHMHFNRLGMPPRQEGLIRSAREAYARSGTDQRALAEESATRAL